MFMELYRGEKREEGDRTGQEDESGETKGERQIQPVISSLSVLHSLEPSERFMELHREEKTEREDRGDWEEKRGNQKGTEQASQ